MVKPDLEKGRELKQMGLDLVEDHNETFVEQMRRYATALAKRDGRVTSDDLRRVAAELDIEPDHPNAWGAVFRGKHWKPVGFENSQIPSNHARTIRIWTWSGP